MVIALEAPSSNSGDFSVSMIICDAAGNEFFELIYSVGLTNVIDVAMHVTANSHSLIDRGPTGSLDWCMYAGILSARLSDLMQILFLSVTNGLQCTVEKIFHRIAMK